MAVVIASAIFNLGNLHIRSGAIADLCSLCSANDLAGITSSLDCAFGGRAVINSSIGSGCTTHTDNSTGFVAALSRICVGSRNAGIGYFYAIYRAILIVANSNSNIVVTADICVVKCHILQCLSVSCG